MCVCVCVCVYLQLQPGRRLSSRPVDKCPSQSLFTVRSVARRSAADEVPQILKVNKTDLSFTCSKSKLQQKKVLY